MITPSILISSDPEFFVEPAWCPFWDIRQCCPNRQGHSQNRVTRAQRWGIINALDHRPTRGVGPDGCGDISHGGKRQRAQGSLEPAMGWSTCPQVRGMLMVMARAPCGAIAHQTQSASPYLRGSIDINTDYTGVLVDDLCLTIATTPHGYNRQHDVRQHYCWRHGRDSSQRIGITHPQIQQCIWVWPNGPSRNGVQEVMNQCRQWYWLDEQTSHVWPGTDPVPI